MLTYNQRAAEIMKHLVLHDAHGYSQPNRRGDGTIEVLTLSDGTVTSVHGGDYDCSEAVRMCYVAAGVLPRGCYMWTGNEATLLKQHGFVQVSKSNLQVGDVLLRNGHTEMVISVDGALKQAGFRMSEHRSINGTKGDQTGWEATYSGLNTAAWSWAYRYEGAQPSGASSTPTIAEVSNQVPAGRYQCVVDALNVRTGPGTGYGSVAQYTRGQHVTLDGTSTVADGCVWGRYIGGSGNYRYIAVRTTGGMEYLKLNGSAETVKQEPSVDNSVPAGTYKIDASVLNVRSGPSIAYRCVAQYKRGQTVRLDGYSSVADGCVWGRYTGSSSGKKRFIAVRTTSGSVYAHRI